MLRVNIKGRRLKFRNSFDELTINQFAAFVEKDNQLIKEMKASNELADTIEELIKAGDKDEADFLLADLAAKKAKIKIRKIELFSLLSDRPEATEDYLLSTDGIAGQVKELIEEIDKRFGQWQSYFEKCKPIRSFRFADFRRHGIRRLKRTNFFVADLNRQSLIRDAAAVIVAQQIGNFRAQFERNDWRNFARFAAYVCRPAKEEFEYMPKRRRASFIGGPTFERMSATDRLSVYNQKLKETVDQRTPVFENLPLSIAIGIYKQYFFLKKKSTKNTKASIQATQKRQKKRSPIKKKSGLKQASKT